jgi:hypothetical protein
MDTHGNEVSAAHAMGWNVLLEGPTGVGKTFSIGTLVDTGLEVCCLFTESGQETLFGYYADRGLPIPDNLHIHQVKAGTASFSDLIDSAKKTNSLSHEALAKMTDPRRGNYNGYINILTALNNFTDQRTGESFGGVDSWGVDRVLVLDGLTGVNRAAMQLVAGGKAARTQAEWGQAQFYVEEMLQNLTNGCRCHFVLIAHIERETDMVLGGSKITMSTLGKALAPKIPQMFSDVVLCRRDGDKFFWSTADVQADLKVRNLKLGTNLTPDFRTIHSKWLSRVNGVYGESSDQA